MKIAVIVTALLLALPVVQAREAATAGRATDDYTAELSSQPRSATSLPTANSTPTTIP